MVLKCTYHTCPQEDARILRKKLDAAKARERVLTEELGHLRSSKVRKGTGWRTGGERRRGLRLMQPFDAFQYEPNPSFLLTKWLVVKLEKTTERSERFIIRYSVMWFGK